MVVYHFTDAGELDWLRTGAPREEVAHQRVVSSFYAAIPDGAAVRWPEWVLDSTPAQAFPTVGERLVWAHEGMLSNPNGPRIAQADGFLTAFLNLGDRPAESFAAGVVRVARHYGTLFPAQQGRSIMWRDPADSGAVGPQTRLGYCGFEYLEEWRFYVKRFRAIATVLAKLGAGQPARRTEVADLFVGQDPGPEHVRDWGGADEWTQWSGVSHALDRLLQFGGARQGLDLVGTPPRPALGSRYDNGVGLLALQLLYSATGIGKDAVAVKACCYCGAPATRTRTRRAARPVCDREECQRAAKREARRRQREAAKARQA